MFTSAFRPPRIDTLIAKKTRVSGDVAFEGGLHIDGHVAGGVRCLGPAGTLSVSESGSIEGTVEVPFVTLLGVVRGDIHAHGRVVLGATARVEGNVYYGTIEMTLGAQISGKLVQTALPPAGQLPPGRRGQPL